MSPIERRFESPGNQEFDKNRNAILEAILSLIDSSQGGIARYSELIRIGRWSFDAVLRGVEELRRDGLIIEAKRAGSARKVELEYKRVK